MGVKIQMTYDEVILEYAKMVQIYSPDGMRIYNMLEKKIKDYALEENFSRRDYWKEVKSQFLGKSSYVDYEYCSQLETIHKDLSKLFNVTASKVSGVKIHEWITLLPQIKEYVERMVDYRIELDEEFLSTADEAFSCTRDTLKFFNSVLQVKTFTDKDLFDYIPILIWSLENLFIYGVYSCKFDKFILERIIPIFRKHRIASNNFAELISREILPKSSLAHSTLFSARDDYECPHQIIDITSTPLDIFSNSLIYGFKNGTFKNVDLDNAKTIRKQNPLYSLYRFYHFAEQLMIEEETVYITLRKIGTNIYNTCQTQIDTYSEENILFVLLCSVKQILASEPGTGRRDLAMWDNMAEEVIQSLDILLESQVLCMDKAVYVRRFLSEGRRRVQNGLVGNEET